ncbi:hypothetical protein STEG23_024249 [Scotinomys teguina]
MEAPLRPAADILRRNPQHDYELVQRVGSGTYGDVYKVDIVTDHPLLQIGLLSVDNWTQPGAVVLLMDQLSCISEIYVTIHNSSKITVMK